MMQLDIPQNDTNVELKQTDLNVLNVNQILRTGDNYDGKTRFRYGRYNL